MRHERLAGAVTALQAGCLLRAWRSWVDYAAASLHKRQLLRVAAARLANHHAHAAFSAWKARPPASDDCCTAPISMLPVAFGAALLHWLGGLEQPCDLTVEHAGISALHS